MKNYDNVTIFNHPLINHKIAILRDEKTSMKEFRELIEESVKSCISAYKARANSAKNPTPLTDEQFDGMREIGKFAFGVHYNENEIDEAKAIETAIDAVTDGLVRVFKGNDEITDLDAEIEIAEGDVFTFVRLTMLSGRMW